MKTIIGLIILLFPFLLVNNFKNKKSGGFYVLSFMMFFHLAIAVLTQSFHIFNYNIVLGINVIACIIILKKFDFNKFRENIKSIKIDWIFIFVLIILSIQFFSVHYNYTGEVTTISESYKQVKNIKYVYPYFSDEWIAVSLVKYSIESGSLPLSNPLWYNTPFPNLELGFHSFVSEIILLLNLNPLTQYTLLSIFTSILICVLVYFILRINKVSKLISAIACLSIPYIINGANLPGIWTLTPIIIGIITMLLGFLFMSVNSKKMSFFLAFMTLIFYPPLFIFYSVALIFYVVSKDIPKNEKQKLLFLYLLLCVVAALILLFFVISINPFKETIYYIFSKIFYKTFTEGFIPNFNVFKVIPIPIFLISIFGIFKIPKKKTWLIAPVFAGALYWVLYSFVTWRFIIEYERVVFATSLLIVLISGFGFQYLIKYLRECNFIKKEFLQIILLLILILFFIMSFSYTNRDNWKELKLYSIDGGKIFNPASPANNYLYEDDLELFKEIKEKSFLTLPWKGTVIGAATNNYPLETKPSTITNRIARFSDFMNAECNEKLNMAKNKKIDYIYSPEFNCGSFNLVGQSNEWLYLYEIR